jgi:hypothetical protein
MVVNEPAEYFQSDDSDSVRVAVFLEERFENSLLGAPPPHIEVQFCHLVGQVRH